MTPIHFGTDGWRGIIGADFTRENVERIASAYVSTLREEGRAEQGVVVGYDARFLSERMARLVADVLGASGVPVTLASRICTSPSVSLAVAARGAAGGLVVSASHNPPEYNGIKFKGAFGGSVSSDEIHRIEACLGSNTRRDGTHVPTMQADLLSEYQSYLETALPTPTKARQLKIVVDPMHGAASGLTAEFLRRRGHEVLEIRASRNPLFGGISPEPISPHINALCEAVVREGADLGVATDGDGDRIGAVNAQGEFFDAHRILALFAYDALAVRGKKGRIVKTVSTTGMLDRICAAFGAPCVVSPIGFKYVCDEIRRGNVLVAGEESGGIWTEGYCIPERDGVRMSLLLADLLASQELSLMEMWKNLTARFGEFAYRRRDIRALQTTRAEIEKAATNLSSVCCVPVARIETTDGIKVVRTDGYWLMFRYSGTEPLLRLYAEAANEKDCERFLDEAEQLVARYRRSMESRKHGR